MITANFTINLPSEESREAAIERTMQALDKELADYRTAFEKALREGRLKLAITVDPPMNSFVIRNHPKGGKYYTLILRAIEHNEPYDPDNPA